MIAEELSILSVRPAGAVRPQQALTATFVVENPATARVRGLRARIDLPDALRIREATCNGAQLRASSLRGSGVPIGELAGGASSVVVVELDVVERVDDATELAVQAIIIAQKRELGSNIIRIPVVSAPALSGRVAVAVVGDRAAAGGDVAVELFVSNDGASSAHDVEIAVPLPDGATLAGASELCVEDGHLFGRETVLAGGAVRSYRATLTIAGMPEVVAIGAGVVRAVDHRDVVLDRPEPVVIGRPEFGPPTVEVAPAAPPGALVPLRVCATNRGSAAASATLTIAIGTGGELVRQAVTVRGAGAGLRSRGRKDGVLDLGRVAAGETVVVEGCVAVDGVLAGNADISVDAELRGADSVTRATASIAVTSRPAFGPERNHIEAPRAARAGETVPVTVRIANDGTAGSADLVLALACDAVQRWSARGRSAKLFSAGPNTAAVDVAIEPLAAGQSRDVELDAQLVDVWANGSTATIRGGLRCAGIDLAAVTPAEIQIRAQPELAGTRSVVPDEPLRPGETGHVRFVLQNVGHDVAREVELELVPSPELAAVPDAQRRDPAVFAVGDVAPGDEVAIDAEVCLDHYLPDNMPARLDAIVRGTNHRVLRLDPAWIPTFAEPRLTAELDVDREELLPGEVAELRLTVRNDGDGPAVRATLHARIPELLTYVSGSTSASARAVRDVVAGGALGSTRGLVLEQLEPGAAAVVTWRVAVGSDVDEARRCTASAEVRCGEQNFVVSSAALRIRAVSAFDLEPVTTAGTSPAATLPALDRATHVPEHTAPAPQSEEVAASGDGKPGGGDVPPMVAVVEAAEAAAPAAQPPATIAAASPVVDDASLRQLLAGDVVSSLELTGNRIEKIRGVLEKAAGRGLVTHLFALRMFFPDYVIAGSDVSAAVDGARDALKAVYDWLFVRLGLDGYTVHAADLDTRELRCAVLSLVDAVLAAQPAPPAECELRTVGALRATIDREKLQAQREQLAEAALGDALPVAVLARFIGTETAEAAVTEALRAYRDRFIDTFWLYAGMPDFLAEPPLELDDKLAAVLAALDSLGVAV